jgi:hypothetical protein
MEGKYRGRWELGKTLDITLYILFLDGAKTLRGRIGLAEWRMLAPSTLLRREEVYLAGFGLVLGGFMVTG